MNYTEPLWHASLNPSSSYLPLDTLIPSTITYPFYFSPRPDFIPNLPDRYLSLIVPVFVYWGASLFFHIADISNSRFFEPYRLHEPEEVTKRNRVTPREVVVAVLLQHSIQTLMGLLVIEDDPPELGPGRDHRAAMAWYAPYVLKGARMLLGEEYGMKVLLKYGPQITEWVYWWGVPIFQFFLATLITDVWQYFWHRLFHTSTFLYKHIHSLHHRLYVPYAYGALYNHPLEGFIFDTGGALVSHLGSFMTLRQATLFFGISSVKTVDDHCGFALPWDPLQILFMNTAATHDIHHQIFGLKKNFSQPFYINWDLVFGTYLDPKDVKKRMGARGVKKVVTDERDPLVQEQTEKKVESKKDL